MKRRFPQLDFQKEHPDWLDKLAAMIKEQEPKSEQACSEPEIDLACLLSSPEQIKEKPEEVFG